MSRAAESTTRNLTDQQLAQQNQLISQSNQQGKQDRSLLMPTTTSLLNSQGYTPQQQCPPSSPDNPNTQQGTTFPDLQPSPTTPLAAPDSRPHEATEEPAPRSAPAPCTIPTSCVAEIP